MASPDVEQLRELQEAVAAVGAQAVAVTASCSAEAGGSPLAVAQAKLALAHALAQTFTRYLAQHGVAAAEHPFNKQLERLGTYKAKVSAAENKKWLKEHRPGLQVHVAAANRVISHAIPDLTPDQRAALRQIGEQREQAGRPSGGQAVGADAAGEAERFFASLAEGEEAVQQSEVRGSEKRPDKKKKRRT